jgi:hypothetical protein
MFIVHLFYLKNVQGMNEITEMYSAIAAEVPVAADPQTFENIPFINQLKTEAKVSKLLSVISMRPLQFHTSTILFNQTICRS